jgi:hypothetical protein
MGMAIGPFLEIQAFETFPSSLLANHVRQLRVQGYDRDL